MIFTVQETRPWINWRNSESVDARKNNSLPAMPFDYKEKPWWTIRIVQRSYNERANLFTALIFWFVLDQAKMNNKWT